MYNAQLTYERIDKIAKSRGIPINKLNENCALSKNAISQSAKSEFGMKAKNIFLISEMLDVSTDYLLGRTDTYEISPNYSNNSISNSNNVAFGENSAVTAAGSDELGKKPLDEMTEELVKAFKTLSFSDKMEVMNLVLKKNKE